MYQFKISKFLFVLIILFKCFFVLANDDLRDLSPQELKQRLDAATDIEEKARICHELAWDYFDKGKFHDSVAYFSHQILTYTIDGESVREHLDAHYLLGIVSLQRDNDSVKARAHLEKSKVLKIQFGLAHRAHHNDNVIAGTYTMEGDYKNALIHFEKAYNEGLKYKDYPSLSLTASNRGNIFNELKQYDEALENYKNALHFLEQDKGSRKRVNSYFAIKLNMTDVYINMEKIEQADSVLQVLKQDLEEYPNYKDKERIWNYELILLDKKGDHELLFKKAKELLPLLDPKKGYNRSHYERCLYHYGMGLIRFENSRGVKDVITELEINIDGNNVIRQKSILQYIYTLSKESGRYKKALNAFERHQSITDSLENLEIKKQVKDLEIKYETAETDRLLKSEQVKNLKSQRWLSVLVGLLLLAIAVSTLLFFRYKFKKAQDEKRIMETEHQLLNMQMNPHFIFNAINSIQSYLFEDGDRDLALENLGTFAALIRQLLELNRQKFIPLEEEISFLENYLKVQLLRYENQFDYQINIGDIEIEETLIPPMFLQPAIENAIEHGKIFNREDGYVKINMSRENGYLNVAIIDNGVGIEESLKNKRDINLKKESLALNINKERLALFSSMLKKDFSLHTKSNPKGNGTQVDFILPVKEI